MNFFNKTSFFFLNFVWMPFGQPFGDTLPPDLSGYTIMLCGNVSNEILNDINSYDKRNKKSDKVNVLILMKNEDPNGISDERVVSDGEVLFKGDGMVKFKASFIMTLDKGMHTDTVTYLSKEDKIIGGYFYKNEIRKDEEVYISKVGSVYHIDVAQENDKNCLDGFK